MWSFSVGFQGLMRLSSSVKLIDTTLLTIMFMDLRDVSQKLSYCASRITYFTSVLLWSCVHVLLSIWYFMLDVVSIVESSLVSYGLLKKYGSFDVSKLQYLAIVIESEEARHISHVIELLNWVAAIGVRHVSVYDMEGVLKKSQEKIIAKCNARPWKGLDNKVLMGPEQLTLEFVAASDGKQGIERAANLLFKKYQEGNENKPKFTEPILDEALRLVGCSGPEPDLLLIYGPTRCHLGFPAWRIRYTEMLHMGTLRSKKYGSLVKAIYRFSTIRQNYGT